MEFCADRWKVLAAAMVTAMSMALALPVHSAEEATQGQQDAAPAKSKSQAQDADAKSADESGDGEAKDAKDTGETKLAEKKLLKGITWEKRFDVVDTDDNQSADWSEVSQSYQRELSQAGWKEQTVFSRFDRNKDGRLEETEYFFFMSALAQDLRIANSEQELAQE